MLIWILINVAAVANTFLFAFEHFTLLILAARIGLVAAVLAAPVILWEEPESAPGLPLEQV